MRNGPPSRFPKVLFVALLAVLVMLSPVFAQETQTAILYPTDDAYVDLAATALNFGSAPLLELSWSSVQTAGGGNKLQIDRLAYLKFDLSMSKDSIIRSALLKLYVTNAVANSSIIVALRTKNTAWNETTITGKNAPEVPASEKDARDRGIGEVKVTKLEAWYSLNVTSYARSVRSGLLSLMVIGGNTKSPWSDIVQFHSKESADPALRPYLEVSYSGTQAGGGTGQSIVYLTLRSSLAGGFVYFNGTEYEIPNSLEVILDVPTGRYQVGASPTIAISNRARAVFQKWNDGSVDNPRGVQVSKSITLEAKYVEQYYLNVTSQYGVANGTGWYLSGSRATVGVSGDPGANPPKVQAEGILGLLGGSYVFDHWSGYSTRSPSLKIVVDDPLTVTAIWRPDYSLLYSYLIRGALSLGAGLAAALLVRRRVLGTPQRVGMDYQLRTGMERRRRSALTVRSIEQAEPAPSVAPRRVVGSEAPTRSPPFTRAVEPPRAPRSVATVAPAPPTRRAADVESAGVIRREEFIRDYRGEPARVVASTTVASAAPMRKITKFCRECGVKIPRDSKYCEECGKKLV